jgi:putative FmdB family regulatory protein
MPLYEYECPKCHTISEHLMSNYEEIKSVNIVCVDCNTICYKILSSDFDIFQPKTAGRLAEQNTLKKKGLSY